MPKPVIMPKLGFTQDSSEIVRWLKQAGEAVEQGDPIVEVTTDKVNMEVEAPSTGILDGIRYEAGAIVPVTEVIAFIRAPDEPPLTAPSVSSADSSTLSPTGAASEARATPIAAKLAQEKGIDLNLVHGTGPGGRITKSDVQAFGATEAPTTLNKVRAVPAARRLARELGIDLATVQGSGPRGRVQSADVRTAEARQAKLSPSTITPSNVLKTIPLTGMRLTIATRMQKSAQEAPHITFDADVDVTAAQDLRSRINALLNPDQPRVSLTAVIVKACAWALQRHPLVNSRLQGQEILLLKDVNIGVAVALEEGLIVPVIKAADQKGLTKIAVDIAQAAERARQGRLQMDDLTGGTFTVSNLGMFGVDRFTAIINPPETAIIAIGQVTNRLVPDAQGQPIVRPMLTATLSADHRVVDGAEAARFLSDVRRALEHPELFLM
jgi:pyruvate dehydrogenase E2 component (dihydrolipoamide acetyltransferase)